MHSDSKKRRSFVALLLLPVICDVIHKKETNCEFETMVEIN